MKQATGEYEPAFGGQAFLLGNGLSQQVSKNNSAIQVKRGPIPLATFASELAAIVA